MPDPTQAAAMREAAARECDRLAAYCAAVSGRGPLDAAAVTFAGGKAVAEQCAAAIRALPLPEDPERAAMEAVAAAAGEYREAEEDAIIGHDFWSWMKQLPVVKVRRAQRAEKSLDAALARLKEVRRG